ncbi:DUF4136 domain-containing protein [Chitinivorax sp. PXF-14]|uniref:DUF4136 domain-containing protein n=1 Tax=Chitinivorax sp. PXF-14 TaxID=3230488 RepID=UPI003466F481
MQLIPRLLPVAALALALGPLAGCGGSVHIVQDNEARVVPQSPYAWARPEPRPAVTALNADIDNDIVRGKLESAIDTELGRLAFRKVAYSDARYLVSYHIGVQQKQRIVADPLYPAPIVACGTRHCWGALSWGYWGPPIDTVRSYEYREGSLIIDLQDSASNKLVWRGIYSNTLGDPAKISDKQIQDIVFDILKNLPK